MTTIAQEYIREGIEIGEERGMERGMKRGQKNATYRIARQLLTLHSVVTVSELTGLSIEEVVELQENEE